MNYLASFPNTRLRRLRQSYPIRNLVRETNLSVNDLIWPVFIIDGKNEKQPIPSMPGTFRYSIDTLLQELNEAIDLGINAIALFPNIDPSLKDENGLEAINQNTLVVRAVEIIKNHFPELVVICDIALDPYTTHGHDGILNDRGEVDNDKTIEILCRQAILLAEAGCDIVAPSDMMDGRIGTIRESLDYNGFLNTVILSYAAKYASSFYSAFRDAVGSGKNLGKSTKETYQMDPANSKEALREVALDIQEGADIVMVKPAVHYLDIIKSISDNFPIPVFAYHVSSEYALLKLASAHGLINYDNAIFETLISIKRAGAKSIFTYAAKEVAYLLKSY
ncbi:MAG: porphobilinogen synthase [Sphingobacteriia bacterium]|nr:porphobilinogen synthase [Sphingobacteriia bacterium]